HFNERRRIWEIHPAAQGVDGVREQLIACGFSADLIHAFDSVVVCREPTANELASFIQRSGTDFFRRAMGADETFKLPLEFTPDAMEALAQIASERNGGYRSLFSLGAMIGLRALFEPPNTNLVELGKAAVRDLRAS